MAFLQGQARVACSLSVALLVACWARRRSLAKTAQHFAKRGSKDARDKAAKGEGSFSQQLRRLLRVLIPKLASPEVGYILLVAAMMVARTYCDLWMIVNGTAIESGIITRSMTDFKKHLLKFVAAMMPLASVNTLLKYGLKEISLHFRARLTAHLYKHYLQGFTYYQMSNLDNRIANPDQLLTQDVEKFCDSVADLYSNLSKPILDIALYAFKLNAAIGASGPLIMLVYLVISGYVLNALRKPVSQFTVAEQQLEGQFRHVTSRLITSSEEIAFYNGNEREHASLQESFAKLMTVLRGSQQFRSSMGIVDTITAKYFATVVGYCVVSRPFLNLSHPRHLHSTGRQLMEDYYNSGRMLVKMSQAIGRVLLADRDVARLAGFTSRITEFMSVLKDLNSGTYKRTMLKTEGGAKASGTASTTGVPAALVPNSGKKIEEDYIISFADVPLVTPNGDVLVRSLTFEVKSGMNVLVCGPNGCGKSSLFRTLGELWPLFGGTLKKPHHSKLFYIPQRPYMTVGSLRDQLIYPHSRAAGQCKLSDTELRNFLQLVHLESLLERFTWDSVEDWLDVLSGGEKQRIAMARLFYHRPQFAILDECTSAVSVDVEGFMYDHCKKIGTTLFTVSHRKSLWQYHEYVLQFDGRGAYWFGKISEHTAEFGS
eukprot:m.611106 g.611106  ORF g.611106 m.611106 type:complete len:656 (-) comp58138_c0_seq1:156-2123(-)